MSFVFSRDKATAARFGICLANRSNVWYQRVFEALETKKCQNSLPDIRPPTRSIFSNFMISQNSPTKRKQMNKLSECDPLVHYPVLYFLAKQFIGIIHPAFLLTLVNNLRNRKKTYFKVTAFCGPCISFILQNNILYTSHSLYITQPRSLGIGLVLFKRF